MSEIKKGDQVIVFTPNLGGNKILQRGVFDGEFKDKRSGIWWVAINGQVLAFRFKQVFPDSYNGRAKLYESISEKISNLERQKTIVVNEMRDLEHAWASAEDIDKD